MIIFIFYFKVILSKYIDNEIYDNENITPKFILKQKLDHFNSQDERTFEQFYYVNDTNYVKGGPVFLQLGGEGPWSSWYMTDSLSATLAKEFGALLVGIEHRYYGNSQPFKNLTLENLKYLSSRQALLDYTVLYEEIINKYQTSGGKWISFGCSYSGCLSLWLRLKFPHIISGSYSGSSPVWANSNYTQYDETCENSLGEECHENMKIAFQGIRTKINSEDFSTLSSDFNTCKLISTEFDKKMFKFLVIDRIQGAVQYNNENKNFPRLKMCEDLKNSPDKYLEYAKQSREDFGDCMDLSLNSYKNLIASPSNNMRPWYYQKATEFGYYKNSLKNSEIFFNDITEDFHNDLVQEIFNKKLIPNVDDTNDYYGGPWLTSNMISNVIITNGLYDPWSKLSILNDISKNVTSHIYNSSGHCAPVYKVTSNTPQDVLDVRKKVGDFINNVLNS